MQERLLSIGGWLKVNGDAIYGTRIWQVQQEPNNGTTFYTFSPASNSVNALFTQWPDNNQIVRISFLINIADIDLCCHHSSDKSFIPRVFWSASIWIISIRDNRPTPNIHNRNHSVYFCMGFTVSKCKKCLLKFNWNLFFSFLLFSRWWQEPEFG